MKQSKLTPVVVLTTLLFAFCGLGLRVYQFKNCMTEDGLIQEGNPILYLMLGLSLAFAVLLGLLCSRIDKSLSDARCLCGPAPFLFAELVGANIIFYGALLRLLNGESIPVFGCGMAAALCLAVASLLYDKRSRHVFWLLILPALFFGALLIVDFKHWSVDPKVIDFFFRQLALVGGMLAVLNVSAFPLRFGKKRMTVFWCGISVMFTIMSLPDFFLRRSVTLGELLIPLGLAVWSASHGLRLLGCQSKNERPAQAYAPRMMEPAEQVPQPRRTGKGRFEHP